ncbi:TetR family transcriptional regulator [Promicromonospora sp. AC04]|uniref:TetR/AcrR family transcriptional regulator n=1 Tax=Promicromonospora sp. AC04 TaxID=2135723 RepID=UPI000D36CD7D|nr:TetR/AcrR family transcriptional regulator [Promicromonospora sp. AC04]PUB20808.1 TetR family transcriptional regulator [Promicromonospora sp. AC04]
MARPRKFTEDDVVASASTAFSAGGYGGTSLGDLVEATGLGKQSIYNAFGGKRELFIRAFKSDAADAVAALDQALAESDASPIERIRAHLLRLAIEFSAEQPRVSLFLKGNAELSDHDPDVASSALEAFSELEQVYLGCIVDAQTCGEVDPDADPAPLAAFYLAFTRGLETIGAAGVGRAKLSAAAITALDVLPLTQTGREKLLPDED